MHTNTNSNSNSNTTISPTVGAVPARRRSWEALVRVWAKVMRRDMRDHLAVTLRGLPAVEGGGRRGAERPREAFIRLRPTDQRPVLAFEPALPSGEDLYRAEPRELTEKSYRWELRHLGRLVAFGYVCGTVVPWECSFYFRPYGAPKALIGSRVVDRALGAAALLRAGVPGELALETDGARLFEVLVGATYREHVRFELAPSYDALAVEAACFSRDATSPAPAAWAAAQIRVGGEGAFLDWPPEDPPSRDVALAAGIVSAVLRGEEVGELRVQGGLAHELSKAARPVTVAMRRALSPGGEQRHRAVVLGAAHASGLFGAPVEAAAAYALLEAGYELGLQVCGVEALLNGDLALLRAYDADGVGWDVEDAPARSRVFRLVDGGVTCDDVECYR